ncbi:hypothetical protein DSO57_1035988 [Entomophthora muscae]|uniref:Uncharacterized protein n=1 Tax=Entomophthora muscae TaxID=34485 RepID=A0ACC2SZM2_9FUNG|nr:hypothetical protein DSO57_1035988 [Entomophthora muscae]
MDIDKEFGETDCEEFINILLSQTTASDQSQQHLPPPVSEPFQSFIPPSNPIITSTQAPHPTSSFDRAFSQRLKQTEMRREFRPDPPNRFIHKETKPDNMENFGGKDMYISREPGSSSTRHQPFKAASSEKEASRFGSSSPSQIPAVTKEKFVKVKIKPSVSARLSKLSKPPANLFQTLELYPTVTFLFEAISHWEKIKHKAPSLSLQLPRSGIPNPLYSRQPTWKVELLQRIASDDGSNKPVLECLHETLQLLFLPGEQSDGYNRMCQKTALTTDQLKYQATLVELRDNLVLLSNYPGYRLRHLPPQLHAQFQQDKIKFLKSFGECLLWLDGLGRFKDVTFLLDIIVSASNTLPTLFGDTLIGQRSLINGILFPLCKILSKANTPEKEKGVLPIELASQIPDRPGIAPAQEGPRTPPLFVVSSILEFLKLLATECPLPCLSWFTCLLEDADILKVLSNDRLMLQAKISVISLLTRIVVSPKVFLLLVKGEPKDSVHCLGALLEWAIDNNVTLEELCDLGECALGYIYTIVVEYPSSFNKVFGYQRDTLLDTSILFPLVAFISQVCDSQSSLLLQIRKKESTPLLFPQATSRPKPSIATHQTMVASLVLRE